MIAFIGVLLLATVHALGAQTYSYGQESPEETELLRVISWIRTRAYDHIPAIDRPEFVAPAAAKVFLRPGDLVIGIDGRPQPRSSGGKSRRRDF